MADAKHTSPFRRRLRRLRRPAPLGVFRRPAPVSDAWGYDRGTPVDRFYIERFLHENRHAIRGRVLEVRDSTYTRRFGTGVTQADVLDIRADNPQATVVADLTQPASLPQAAFDCFVLNQTLQFIFDAAAAVRHAAQVLRPGGVLLATVPVVSRLAPHYGLTDDYWRFTPASCAALFGAVFEPSKLRLQSYGNVLTAMAFLSGMASEELSPAELAAEDPYFPVVVAIRAER